MHSCPPDLACSEYNVGLQTPDCLDGSGSADPAATINYSTLLPPLDLWKRDLSVVSKINCIVLILFNKTVVNVYCLCVCLSDLENEI